MSQLIILGSLTEQAKSFVTDSLPLFLQNALIALIIFFTGKIIANILTNIAVKLMLASKMEETIVNFLKALIYVGLMVVVCLAALDQLGVKTTSFVAILAAAGLAVAMALKDTLGNFASGVMIIMFKPYKVGHFVEIAGTSGVIEEVNLFNTVLRTGDNIQMYLPNGSVTGSKICNYSVKDERRIDLVIGCGYDDDLKAVKQTILDVINEHELVLKDPEPVVAVSELGDSSVNFVVRPWVKNADYWPVRFDLIENIKNAFDKNGFSIPYPQQDVHMYNENNSSNN
ncbi:MAG: mechanosensitive ion channel [Lentisphaerales bacterium]|nr:mechanosensitive ion channel [Lentisphaerales bacterium]